MKNRILMAMAVAGFYLMTSAAGVAQNATQTHSDEAGSNTATTIDAHTIAASPAPAATRKSPEKTLPVAPVAKSDANAAPSLREAQENPYLLLTYKDKDQSKLLANPYKEPPTKVFGPGWNKKTHRLLNN